MPQLSRNVLSLYGARIVAIVSSIALFPFIAHRVGLAAYGVWLLISSITIFFSTSDFGLGTSLIRFVAEGHAREDHEQVNRVISSTIVAFVGLGALMSLIYVGVFAAVWNSLGIPDADRGAAEAILIVVAASTLLVGLPLDAFENVLAGIQRYDVANLLLLIQVLLQALIVVALLLAGLGIVSVAAGTAAANLATSAAAGVIAKRLYPPMRLSLRLVSLRLVRAMLPYSLQVFVIGFAALVILETDDFIIGIFLPVAYVTLYAASFRIYKVCRDVTFAIMQAVVPDASRAQAKGEAGRVRVLLIRGTAYANTLMLALALPTMVFARPLLVDWAGPRFGQVAPALTILVASLLINNNHIVAVGILTGTGRLREYARYHATWALGNLVISVALVHWIGLTGVALGTALPLLLMEPLYIRVALRETGVGVGQFLRAAVLRPYAACAAAAVLPVLVRLLWDPQGLVAIIGVSAAYVALLGLGFLAAISSGERRSLARAVVPIRGMTAPVS